LPSNSASISAVSTATATASRIVLMNTNYTNITNVTAVNAVDKSLAPAEKIGMGVGISIAIIMLLGCCYYMCIIGRRPKEIEKLERRPSQVERRPSQVERRPSRRGSQLEIRAPTTPRATGESKV
jgi:hypothetical protein